MLVCSSPVEGRYWSSSSSSSSSSSDDDDSSSSDEDDSSSSSDDDSSSSDDDSSSSDEDDEDEKSIHAAGSSPTAGNPLSAAASPSDDKADFSVGGDDFSGGGCEEEDDYDQQHQQDDMHGEEDDDQQQQQDQQQDESQMTNNNHLKCKHIKLPKESISSLVSTANDLVCKSRDIGSPYNKYDQVDIRYRKNSKNDFQEVKGTIIHITSNETALVQYDTDKAIKTLSVKQVDLHKSDTSNQYIVGTVPDSTHSDKNCFVRLPESQYRVLQDDECDVGPMINQEVRVIELSKDEKSINKGNVIITSSRETNSDRRDQLIVHDFVHDTDGYTFIVDERDYVDADSIQEQQYTDKRYAVFHSTKHQIKLIDKKGITVTQFNKVGNDYLRDILPADVALRNSDFPMLVDYNPNCQTYDDLTEQINKKKSKKDTTDDTTSKRTSDNIITYSPLFSIVGRQTVQVIPSSTMKRYIQHWPWASKDVEGSVHEEQINDNWYIVSCELDPDSNNSRIKTISKAVVALANKPFNPELRVGDNLMKKSTYNKKKIVICVESKIGSRRYVVACIVLDIPTTETNKPYEFTNYKEPQIQYKSTGCPNEISEQAVSDMEIPYTIIDCLVTNENKDDLYKNGRGLGLAPYLMETAGVLVRAQGNNLPKFLLWVNNGSKEAIRLYMKCGFLKVNEDVNNVQSIFSELNKIHGFDPKDGFWMIRRGDIPIIDDTLNLPPLTGYNDDEDDDDSSDDEEKDDKKDDKKNDEKDEKDEKDKKDEKDDEERDSDNKDEKDGSSDDEQSKKRKSSDNSDSSSDSMPERRRQRRRQQSNNNNSTKKSKPGNKNNKRKSHRNDSSNDSSNASSNKKQKTKARSGGRPEPKLPTQDTSKLKQIAKKQIDVVNVLINKETDGNKKNWLNHWKIVLEDLYITGSWRDTNKKHKSWITYQRSEQERYKEDRIKLLRDAEFPLNRRQQKRELPEGIYVQQSGNYYIRPSIKVDGQPKKKIYIATVEGKDQAIQGLELTRSIIDKEKISTLNDETIEAIKTKAKQAMMGAGIKISSVPTGIIPYHGVTLTEDGNYCAKIQRIHVGVYDTQVDAAYACDIAAKRLSLKRKRKKYDKNFESEEDYNEACKEEPVSKPIAKEIDTRVKNILQKKGLITNKEHKSKQEDQNKKTALALDSDSSDEEESESEETEDNENQSAVDNENQSAVDNENQSEEDNDEEEGLPPLPAVTEEV